MSSAPLSWEQALRKCYGKRRFSSRKDARQAATRLERSSGTPGWPYYCSICRAYHLTRQSPKKQKRIRKRLRYLRAREGSR